MDSGHGLKKEERLSSLTVIDQLFSKGGSLRASAFPLCAVFALMPRSPRLSMNAMLVSVSKRRFKHSVDRNRIKRQVREAYRLNKDILAPLATEHPNQAVAIAFIYLSDRHTPSDDIHRRVRRLLHQIVEKLQAEADNKPSEQ